MTFSISPKNQDEVNESFLNLAQELLNEYEILVGNRKYRILEIEFYYNDNSNHSDTYCYKTDKNLTYGKWFFHYSGIDITFGKKNAHGGILIRSIVEIIADKNTSDDLSRVICGPLKLKNELLNNFDSVFSEQVVFKLQKGIKRNHQIVQTRRIGLNPEKNPIFYEKEYRFVVYPELILKCKNYLKKHDRQILENKMRNLSFI